jgi:hypothetical protein
LSKYRAFNYYFLKKKKKKLESAPLVLMDETYQEAFEINNRILDSLIAPDYNLRKLRNVMTWWTKVVKVNASADRSFP